MTRWTRRGLLAATAGTTAATLAGCSKGRQDGGERPWAPVSPLHVPPVLRPTPGPDGELRASLALTQGRHAFLPGHPVPSWGINGPILGPTIRLRRGTTAHVAVTNQLPETTTIHWHGLDVAATFDGGPHQPIDPGATWRPALTADQPAATLWYHPHPHGTTALHVHRGLAGLLLVDDPATPVELPHTYGVDDIPLVLQDRTIDGQGRSILHSDPTFGYLGTDVCVNATLQPVLAVTTRLVRFRILNGSNARLYHLEFSDGRTYRCIGNDVGLLPRPAETSRISLGPGERAEVVVEFTPGDRTTLLTRGGDEGIDAGDHNILDVRAADTLRAETSVPTRLGGREVLVPPPTATHRRFTLQGHDAINGRPMDMNRIDEVVPASAVEVWEVENTVYSHNFHIHGANFTVLDVNGTPPPAWASGRRDTVHLPARQSARLAVQVTRHVDPHHPYMYHCHILRHEDAGMMGQFLVVDPPDVSTTPRSLDMPHPQAGHTP